MALANGLGWPFAVKRLSYRRHETLARLLARPSLSAVASASRPQLTPPWPDLVIAAGRATEAVGFWIKRHGNPAVKLVYVGTPWSALGRFDLVIATPQYRLPQHPRVLRNALPLHGVTRERLAEAEALWSPRLAHLPRPLTAVLAGGSSGPYVFKPEAGRRLGLAANRLVQEAGGGLLISTSARTPPTVTDAIIGAITVPHLAHRFETGGSENPLFGYLALADRVIVTADSISMIAEAAATGKPVTLFDIEEGARSMRAEERISSVGGRLPPPRWLGADFSSTLFRLAMRLAPPRWSRDLRIVHRDLVDSGAASWMDEPHPSRPVPAQQDLERAVSAVRNLFEQRTQE